MTVCSLTLFTATVVQSYMSETQDAYMHDIV